MVRLRRFSFLRDLIVFCWSHSRTRKPVEYASPARAQGGAGTDRGCFLAIHPLPPPSWLCISTARTSSRSSSPRGRARAHAGQYGFNAYSLYFRADDVQSPAAMPEPMEAALFGRSYDQRQLVLPVGDDYFCRSHVVIIRYRRCRIGYGSASRITEAKTDGRKERNNRRRRPWRG